MLEHSTQYNNWCFINKENDLETIKQQKVTRYRKIYQKVLTKNSQAEIQIFNVEDENLILNFYVSQISQLCQAFPLKVEASAISYFKRFFLKTVLLNHDPKRYLFTSVYLALKTEEVHVDSFEMLAQSLKDPEFSRYPEYEQEVLKMINFDLKIYNPFTPVLSLLERLKEDEKMKWDLEKFHKVYNECIKIVRLCFYDYLIFEIPHGVISLGAFVLALNRNGVEWEENSSFADIVEVAPQVQSTLDRVRAFVERYEAMSLKEEAVKALKKLKNYRNQKQKEEFVKPTEKHPHPNPPSEQQTGEKKP